MRLSFFLILLFSLLAPLRSQKPQLVIPIGHTKAVTAVEYTPDGKHLVSVSADKKVKIWKRSGELVRTLGHHTEAIRDLSVSPDGQYFFTGTLKQGTLCTIEGEVILDDIRLPKEDGFDTPSFSPSFSPDSKWMVVNTADGLAIYDLAIRRLSSIKIDGNRPGHFHFSKDGKSIYAYQAGMFNRVSLQTGASKKVVKFGRAKDSESIPFFLTPDETKAYFLYFGGGVSSLDIRKGKFRTEREGELGYLGYTFNYQAMSREIYWYKWIPTGTPDKIVLSTSLVNELYEFNQGGLQPIPLFEKKASTSAKTNGEMLLAGEYFAHPYTYSADGRYLLTRIKANTAAAVLDAATGEVLSQYSSLGVPFTFMGPGSFLPFSSSSINFSPVAEEVAVGKSDGSLQIYSVNGKLLEAFDQGDFNKVEWISEDASNGNLLNLLINDGITEAYVNRQLDSVAQELIGWQDMSDVLSLLPTATFDLSNAALSITGVDTMLYVYNLKDFDVEAQNIGLKKVGLSTVFAVEDPNIVIQEDNPNPGSYFTYGMGEVMVGGARPFIFLPDRSVSDVGISEGEEYLIIANSHRQTEVYELGCLAGKLTGEQDVFWGPISSERDESGKIKSSRNRDYDYNRDEVMEAQRKLVSACRKGTLSLPLRPTVLATSASRDEALFSRGSRLYRSSLDGATTDSLLEHSLDIIGAEYILEDRFIISWSEDHSIKIWNADGLTPLASMLILNEKDWIVTTPSGLFDASPDAMNSLYYSIGLELLQLNQLKERYYEPGLLQKLLGYSNESIRPVEGFDEVDLFPEIIANIDKGSLHIELRERNGGIGKTSVFINGKEVIEEANPLPATNEGVRPVKMDIPLETYRRYFIGHPDSTNVISIRAYNEEGWLKSKPFQLQYRPPSSKGTSGNRTGSTDFVGQYRPKMYAITIGTRDYKGEDLDLAYPDKDALAMAIAIRETAAALFNDRGDMDTGDSLEVHCLSTSPLDAEELQGRGISWNLSSKTNIEKVFRDIGSRAKAEDVILVYFSGHGMAYGTADQAQFYYLTRDVANGNLSDNAVRQQFAISTNEITDWLNTIPALKQVLIVDACNSGTLVDEVTTGGTKDLNSDQLRALERMKDRTGMFVISGSASDKVSYEASEYGQGLLTYALLQGIIASGGTRKYIDVMTLLQYATDEVPRLAATINGIQTPRLGIPANAASFDIGIADQALDIPISKIKPVMIRSTFLNGSSYRDDQQLATLLETEFRKESEKGYKADLLYVNTSVYPGAYSVSGIYEVSDNGTITLSAKLFKDAELIKDLEIPATDSAKKLVRYLKRAVEKVLID